MRGRRPRAAGVLSLAAAAVIGLAAATAAQANPPLRAGAMAEGPDEAARSAPAAPLIPYSGRLTLSPGDGAPAAGKDLSRTTLAPAPADAAGFGEVEIAPRRTVVLSSQSSWEKGFESLAAVFRTLDEIVLASGLDVRGRPFAVFTHTDEAGFRFDAMLPVAPLGDEAQAREAMRQAAAEHDAARPTEGGGQAASDIRFGTSPAGKAFRFVHASSYVDIEGAYEAITTYLDSRNIVVEDTFIEEYVTDLTDPTDESLEVYIYVKPAATSRGKPAPTTPGSTETKMAD